MNLLRLFLDTKLLKTYFEASKTENLECFQVYGQGDKGNLNLLVDKIWLENNRIYFRVLEMLSNEKNRLRKETGSNIYSIHEQEIFTIRCRLYF